MKKFKHLLPLLLIAVLLMGMLPLGAFAQEDPAEPAEATPTPAVPEAIVSSGSSPEEAQPPAETAPPTDTPAPESTAEPTPIPTEAPTDAPEPSEEPTPVPTKAPTETPEPTDVQEDKLITENDPSIEAPYGDGISMGPNDPSEDMPMLYAADGDSAHISIHYCYDSNNNQIKYSGSFYNNSNGHNVGGKNYPRYAIYANNNTAFCLEPGVHLVGGDTVYASRAHVWSSFSSDTREAIRTALVCGEPGSSGSLSGSFGSQYTATALIIWELVTGCRSSTPPYSVWDSKVVNSVCSDGANSEVKSVYDQISSAMNSFNILPSFANPLTTPPQQHEMQYNDGTYTLTLTDSNGVLSNYNVTCTDSNVSLSVSGNTLTMTSSVPIPGATVNFARKSSVSPDSQIIAYGGAGYQETIIGIEAAIGTPGYLSIKTAYIPKGNLKIVKTSSDGKVAGITFTVTGPGVNTTGTTGADGTFTLNDLTPGTYTVTESVLESYVCDNPSQTVTVEYDQTATVNFANKLKQWRVSVTKVDAEAGVRRSSGATLVGAVYGIYKDGELLDSYTIDESDQFVTKLYPCGTGYELKEITPPTGYTLDTNSYPVGLEPGVTELAANDTAITVQERIIKGKLVVVKQDALTQTPLAGAVFTVYDETGATVTEATTGEDGTLTVESLPYGKYTCKETTPPDGYQLDETVFDFAIETDGQIVTLTRDNIYCVGSITVHKVDTQGSALSGTTYLLEWSEDGSTWAPVVFREDTTPTIGGCTSLGLADGQLTTGEDGSVLFDGLVANGKVYYSACTMRITYSATIDSDACVVYGDKANPNEVLLTWRRTNSEYYDTLNDDCHVYVYGLDLTKEFSDGAGDFDSVHFLLHNDTDNYYVQASLQEGIYYVTGHTQNEADATVFIPVNKHIIVKGVEDDTYSITETATDEGYTLLKDAVKVVISTAEGTVCDVCHKPLLTASATVNGNAAEMTAEGESAHALVQMTVVNTKGFDLPQTGSNGTWLYTTIGIVVMAGAAAVVVFIIRRKNGR